MMLPFKRLFAPFVWEGSKTHTIRMPRKLRPRAGETCYIYTDSRRPKKFEDGEQVEGMAKLGEWECARVETITIEETFRIEIGGTLLSPDETQALAWRDGFRPVGSSSQRPGNAIALMRHFWEIEEAKNPARRHPFHGDLIHWRFDAAGQVSKGELPRWLKNAIDLWVTVEPLGKTITG